MLSAKAKRIRRISKACFVGLLGLLWFSDVFAISVPATSTGSYTVTFDPPSYGQITTLTQTGTAYQTFSISPNTTSKSFANMPSGTYTYEIDRCTDYGPGEPGVVCDSDYGPLPTATVVVSELETPGDIQGPDQDVDGSFDLTWTGVSTSVDYYRLERRAQGQSQWNYTDYSTTTASIQNFGDGLWQFRVSACSNSECGTPTPIKSVIVTTFPLQPFPAISPSSEVAKLPFGVDVTSKGALRVGLPFSFPVGVNGLTPQLSFTYEDSRQSNVEYLEGYGALGEEWLINGAPIVANIEGYGLVVNGKKLIPEDISSPFAPGKKYRLYNNPNIQFTYDTDSVTGLNGWIMKSGDITYRFGFTSLTNNPPVQFEAWFIDSVTDAFGNQINYHYFDDPGSPGWLDSISYGNKEISLKYGYKSIEKNNKSFLAVRLHTITTKVDAIKQSEYSLFYDDVYANLQDVQRCVYDESGVNPACTQPLSLTWSPPNESPINQNVISEIRDGFGKEILVERLLESDSSYQRFTEWPFSVDPLEPGADLGFPSNLINNVWGVTGISVSDGLGGYRQTEYAYYRNLLVNQGVRKRLPDGTYLYTLATTDDNSTSGGGLAITEHYTNKYQDTQNPGVRLSRSEVYWDYLDNGGGNDDKLLLKYAKESKRYIVDDSGNLVGARITKTTPTLDQQNFIVDQMEIESEVGYGFNPDGSIANVESRSSNTIQYNNNITNWVIGFPTSNEFTISNVPGEADVTFNSSRTQAYEDGIPTLKTETINSFEGTLRALSSTTQYTANGNPEIITVSGGINDFESRTVSYDAYDQNQYPTLITNALGHQVTVNEYDYRFGAPKLMTDANTLQTEVESDNFGRRSIIRLDNGTELKTFYNLCSPTPCGFVDGITPSGIPIYFQVRQQTNHNYSSVLQGAPNSIISYDNLGRVIRVESETFNGLNTTKVDTVYDDMGRVYQRSLPYISGSPQAYVTYSYDVRGRVTQIDYPDGSWSKYAYNQSGTGYEVKSSQKSMREQGSVKKRQSIKRYNALGQLVWSQDGIVLNGADGFETIDDSSAVYMEYDYNTQGFQDWVRINGDNRTIVETDYDIAGNAIEIRDPSAGTTQFEYDALGQLTKQTDARGIVTRFHYDKGGRLYLREDDWNTPNQVDNNWTYDTRKIGYLSTRSNPNFTEDYFYNDDSQLQQIVTDIDLPTLYRQYQSSFTYDDYGRVKTQTYPSGLTVYSAYNDSGYTSGIYEGSQYGRLLSKVDSTDEFGVTSYTTGFESGQLTTNLDYDDQTGQLTSIETGGGLIQDHNYSWWSDGTLHQRGRTFSTNATETFTYDNFDRLTDADTTHTYDTRELDFNYDEYGNLQSKRDISGVDVNNYNYNNINPYQLEDVTINGVTHSYNYDPAGNVTTISTTAANEDKTITYNAIGKPTDILKGNLNGNGVIDNPTAQDQFQYGPDGFRFYKKTLNKRIGIVMVGDITVIWPRPTMDQTLYLYGGSFEVVVPAEGSTTDIEKTYLGNVQHIREVSLTSSNSRFEFIHTDHLGSVDVVTNEDGAVVSTSDFDPFGGHRAKDWSTVGNADSIDFQNLHTSRGYTGHEQLDSTGLIHMNGRVYDPTIGRFISADPIVQAPSYSQSYNRYAYVFNNPLSFVDPSGYTTLGLAERDVPTPNPSGDMCLDPSNVMCWSDDKLSGNTPTASGPAITGQPWGDLPRGPDGGITHPGYPDFEPESPTVSMRDRDCSADTYSLGNFDCDGNGASDYLDEAIAGAEQRALDGAWEYQQQQILIGLYQQQEEQFAAGMNMLLSAPTTESSVDFARTNGGSGIWGSISSFILPNITEFGQRGSEGSFGDNAIGAGKGLYNTLLDVADLRIYLRQPWKIFSGTGTPDRLAIADNQLGGAATTEGILFAIGALRASATGTATRLCFVEGTLIHTKDGLKPIEEIEIGDLVASKDEATGDVDWKPVVQLFKNEDKTILNVEFTGENDEYEYFGVTEEHPFWVEGEGWISAGDLKIGDRVTSLQGSKLTVSSITEDPELHTTYNFEVADYHTYFVGEEGVWVHNVCNFAKAIELGFRTRIPPQRAPFNSHGQPVYFNGRGFISPDVDGHNVTNGWKMFDRRGRRTGTWNEDLTERIGN